MTSCVLTMLQTFISLLRPFLLFFFFLPYQRLASCLECKWAIPFNKGTYPRMDDSFVLTYPGTKNLSGKSHSQVHGGYGTIVP